MAALPSLQTLRALEAAVRLRSYTRAAAELGLTHGAISHRLRDLEARLGAALFIRNGNEMHPTDGAIRLAAQIRQALSVLEQAFANDPPSAARAAVVTIAASHALAQTWLAPRLLRYRTIAPDVRFDVRVADGLADYTAEKIDIGIRQGRGAWHGLLATKLFDEVIFPVCTPAYRDTHALLRPHDLCRATLLRNPWLRWPVWFAVAGLDWPEPSDSDSFNDSALLLQAAENGLGVALSRGWLALEAISDGRLVRPFGALTATDEFTYYLVWRSDRRLAPAARQLRDWLLQTAHDDTANPSAPADLPKSAASATA